MNIDDFLQELVGETPEEQKEETQPETVDDFEPKLKTLPARSINVVCGICRKKLKPKEKHWCQTKENGCSWWCTKCL